MTDKSKIIRDIELAEQEYHDNIKYQTANYTRKAFIDRILNTFEEYAKDNDDEDIADTIYAINLELKK